MGKTEILKEIDDRLSEVDVYSEEIDEELVKLGELYAKEGKRKREKRIKELLAKGEYLTYTEALELHNLDVPKKEIMTAMGIEKWRWPFVRFDTPEKFYRGMTADRDQLYRKRKTKTIQKLTKEQRKVAKENGISYSALYNRLHKGWSVEKAISEPTKLLPWTKEQEETVIRLVKEGKGDEEIGDTLNRTAAAIAYKKTQLRKKGLLA